MEADVDEVSILQPSSLQDGGKMAAQMVSSNNVGIGCTTPAAVTHFDFGVKNINTQVISVSL